MSIAQIIFRLAGLTVEIVEGYEKHEDFDVFGCSSCGTITIDEEEYLSNMNGRWTMLLIDNTWRLVNPNRCWNDINNTQIIEPLLNDENETHMTFCNEQAFLIDPEEAIYFYFPHDMRWQLLARPVTRKEFLQLAFIRPAFYDYGLGLQSHAKCFIKDVRKDVCITYNLTSPQGLHFGYELTMLQGDEKAHRSQEIWQQEVNGKVLDRYVLLTQKATTLECSLSFPKEGMYKLEILGRHCKDTEYATTMHTYDFDVLCTHLIQSVEADISVTSYLPVNLRQEWGPGADMDNIGLHPLSHKEAIIEAEDNGDIEVRFRSGINHEVLYELRQNQSTRGLTRNAECVHKDIVVKTKLSKYGKHALDIYVKEKHRGVLFPLVCVYLVTWFQKKDMPDDNVTNSKVITVYPETRTRRFLSTIDVSETARIEYDDTNYYEDLLEWQNSCLSPENRKIPVIIEPKEQKEPLRHLKMLPPLMLNRNKSVKVAYTPERTRLNKKRKSKLTQLKVLEELEDEQDEKDDVNSKNMSNKPLRKIQNKEGSMPRANSNNFTHTNSKSDILHKRHQKSIETVTKKELVITPFWKHEDDGNGERTQTPPVIWTDDEFDDDNDEEELQCLKVPSSRTESRRVNNRRVVLGSPIALRRSRSHERKPKRDAPRKKSPYKTAISKNTISVQTSTLIKSFLQSSAPPSNGTKSIFIKSIFISR